MLIDGLLTGVKFIDYGNKYLAAPSCIYGLEQQFAVLPPLAIQCCLNGVEPKQGNTWQNCSDISSLFDVDLKCTFINRTPQGFSVSCSTNGQDVAEQLIARKLAKSSLSQVNVECIPFCTTP